MIFHGRGISIHLISAKSHSTVGSVSILSSLLMWIINRSGSADGETWSMEHVNETVSVIRQRWVVGDVSRHMHHPTLVLQVPHKLRTFPVGMNRSSPRLAHFLVPLVQPTYSFAKLHRPTMWHPIPSLRFSQIIGFLSPSREVTYEMFLPTPLRNAH